MFLVYDLIMYGPSDQTWVSYVDPVSWALGTPDQPGMAVVSLKSATGSTRWNTIVDASGVWMEASSLPE